MDHLNTNEVTAFSASLRANNGPNQIWLRFYTIQIYYLYACNKKLFKYGLSIGTWLGVFKMLSYLVFCY